MWRAEDDNGTVSVRGAMVTDGPEQHALEPAQPPGADDQKIRVLRGVDENLCRCATDSPWHDRDARLLSEHFACERCGK